jgi:hypothetical protein
MVARFWSGCYREIGWARGSQEFPVIGDAGDGGAGGKSLLSDQRVTRIIRQQRLDHGM